MKLTINTAHKFTNANNSVCAEYTNYGEFDNYCGITLTTKKGSYLLTKSSTPRKYTGWCGKVKASIVVNMDTMELTW